MVSTLRLDREVRTDEVMYVHKDTVAYNIVYHGRTDSFDAADSDPVWQIKRVTIALGIQTIEYAKAGKYRCQWTDRYTYFSPDPLPETDPDFDPLIKPVKNPVNTTVITSPVAGTETNFTLTAIKRFKMINRGNVNIQYAYLPGESGTNYASIPPGASTEEAGIDDQTITLHVQAASPSQRLEVISWS